MQKFNPQPLALLLSQSTWQKGWMPIYDFHVPLFTCLSFSVECLTHERALFIAPQNKRSHNYEQSMRQYLNIRAVVLCSAHTYQIRQLIEMHSRLGYQKECKTKNSHESNIETTNGLHESISMDHSESFGGALGREENEFRITWLSV